MEVGVRVRGKDRREEESGRERGRKGVQVNNRNEEEISEREKMVQ